MRVPFGFKNYVRMFKSRGIRYPLSYFFQVRWFDIKMHVDTHLWVPREFESWSLPNSSHGIIYMASLTKDIKKSFDAVQQLLGKEFESHDFLDLGSGKGKVVLLWHILCGKKKIKQSIRGIEYSEALVEISRANFESVFKRPAGDIFVCEDVTNFDFSELREHIIVFLANPFDDLIIFKVIEKIKSKKVLVIYSTPTHVKVFKESGFSEVQKLKNNWLGSDFDILLLANFEVKSVT